MVFNLRKLNFENIIFQKLLYPILILIVILLACSPLWTGKEFLVPLAVIHWDIFDQHYPFLAFLSDSLHSGSFPLWNPHQYCGTPFFIDTQTQAYYPLTLITALIFKYSLRILQYQLIFTFFLAGIFQYLLARKLSLKAPAAFLGSISYMLSGFFSGHAEHFGIITTFTYLPLIFLFNSLANHKNNFIYAIWGGFFLSFAILGGNPTAIFPMFFGLFIYVFCDGIHNHSMKPFLYFLLILLSALAFASVELIPALSHFSLTRRGLGLNYEESLNLNCFPPLLLLTFLFPRITLFYKQGLFETDISMSSVYVGVLSLLFALWIIVKQPRQIWKLLTMAVISLLAAMGDFSFMRSFLYLWVPFFDNLHAPAVFRGNTVFAMTLISAYGLNFLLEKSVSEGATEHLKSFLKFILTVLSICFLAVLIFLFYSTDFSNKFQTTILNEINLAILFIGLGSLVIYWFLRKKNSYLLFVSLILLVCSIELISAWQRTFYSVAEIAPDNFWEKQDLRDKNRPLSWQLGQPLQRINNVNEPACNQNFSLLNKTFSTSAYNPTILKQYLAILNEPDFKDLLGIKGVSPRCFWLDNSVFIPDQILIYYLMKGGRLALSDYIFIEGNKPHANQESISYYFLNYQCGLSETIKDHQPPKLILEKKTAFGSEKKFYLSYPQKSEPWIAEITLPQNTKIGPGEILLQGRWRSLKPDFYRIEGLTKSGSGFKEIEISKDQEINERSGSFDRSCSFLVEDEIQKLRIQLSELPTDLFLDYIFLSELPKVPPSKTFATSDLEVVNLEPNKIFYQTQRNKDGFLYTGEVFFPGWKAFIDGEKTPILKTNLCFRAVWIPAGKHVVEFRFQPFSFYLGLSVTFISLILFIIINLRSRVSKYL